MCTTGAPVGAATADARVVLPEPAGPSTQTSRLPSERGAGRASASSRTARAVASGSCATRLRIGGDSPDTAREQPRLAAAGACPAPVERWRRRPSLESPRREHPCTPTAPDWPPQPPSWRSPPRSPSPRPPRPASRSAAHLASRASRRRPDKFFAKGEVTPSYAGRNAVMQRKVARPGHVARRPSGSRPTTQSRYRETDHAAPAGRQGLLPGEGRRQRRLRHVVLRQRSASVPSAADLTPYDRGPRRPAGASVRPGQNASSRPR